MLIINAYRCCSIPCTHLSPILAHELHLKQRVEWQLAVRRDGGGAGHCGEPQLAGRTRTDHKFLGVRRVGLKQRLLLRRVGRTVPRIPEERSSPVLMKERGVIGIW